MKVTGFRSVCVDEIYDLIKLERNSDTFVWLERTYEIGCLIWAEDTVHGADTDYMHLT